MGILQSVLQSLGFETDEEESGISTRNSVNLTPLEKWEHARRHDLASQTRSHQMKYVTVPVPDLRDRNVNDRVTNSVGFAKENVPPTPLNNASILENAFGIDDEQAHVESDHDAAVFVGEISNLEIVEEEEEEEEEMQIKRIVAVVEKRKIKHYKKQHKILLVGEGDFSFSACLAVAFGSATNIIATSLNSKAFLEKNYGSALSNIAELRCRGSKVMHSVDATKIATHKLLAHLKFDRIVFNFPFAGFFPKLSPETRLRRHRRLVSLFLKNAKEMVSENGEIHISNKTNGVNAKFNLESIASSHGLRLIAAVKFKCGNYPGYNAKYGFGGDNNFNCYPSNTFKFGLKF